MRAVGSLILEVLQSYSDMPKEIKSLGNHGTWCYDYLEEKGEVFTMPSMCEPVHNLSIEEILRDYSRGIMHPSRTPIYDDGDDITEVEPLEDLVDVWDISTSPQILDSQKVEPSDSPDLSLDSAPDSPEQPCLIKY